MPFHQQIIPVQIGKGHLRVALFMPNLTLLEYQLHPNTSHIHPYMYG